MSELDTGSIVGLGRDEMADAICTQVRDLAYTNPFVDMTNRQLPNELRITARSVD